MKLLFTILIITLIVNAAPYSTLKKSFAKSKKVLLTHVYLDNKKTFYCNNPYERKKLRRKLKTFIIQDEKFYSPRRAIYKSGNVNTRATKVEWEHVMPTNKFGEHLACWKKGGKKACRKDKTYIRMESDMHNLVPAIGEINDDRINYIYGANKVTIGQYGKCRVQIDFKAKKVYVKDEIKGDIARIYLYMSDKYNIILSKQERIMMKAWDKLDPVSQWERIKNKRVEQLQGNSNPYID